MDSLNFPLHSIRLKIESFSYWTRWFFKCANPILKFLSITTCFNNYVCYTTLSALKFSDTCLWYLDSGFSRHMTSNKDLFKTLFEGKIGIVIFGDGNKLVV